MSTQTETRSITYAQAINEAIDQAMEADEQVFVCGLGVPDPKAVFGTTAGLKNKYGEKRVLDMPCAENAMTGILGGAAINGKRPILVHQRLDFALLSLDQIINNAAKWHYMFAGQMTMPLVIRMIIGRGWGQGPQHSQNLQSVFAHIPGLKVIVPTTANDAKGLLLSAIDDPAPVISIEHRWLYNVRDEVPREPKKLPIGKAAVLREGKQVTIVSSSYWTLEALRAAEFLSTHGIEASVVDLRSLRPLDIDTIAFSSAETGHLLVVDGAWSSCGIAGEIIASVVERGVKLRKPPQRITFPDTPTPTSWPVAKEYYPRAVDIAAKVGAMLGKEFPNLEVLADHGPERGDTPDPSFTGPF